MNLTKAFNKSKDEKEPRFPKMEIDKPFSCVLITRGFLWGGYYWWFVSWYICNQKGIPLSKIQDKRGWGKKKELRGEKNK